MAQTGFTPISIYYSSTASNVPTAGNLVAGELAINTADGRLYYKDSSNVVQVIGTKGGVGTSSTTQVLYNSSGLVVGSANMTFSGTALTLANDASISGLTVGKGGGSVASNTVFGVGALASAATGTDLTAIGVYALNVNTTGVSNIAVGNLALISNTTGSYNTAVGAGINGVTQGALGLNTTGAQNTALGYQALRANTTASNNTAVGYQAGYTNATGANNTFVGFNAGKLATGASNTIIGAYAGTSLTTGGYNTFIGALDSTSSYSAGSQITTGSKNTILGAYSGNNGGLDIRTASNYIVLSDGDGNPRQVIDSSGNLLVGATTTVLGARQYIVGTSTNYVQALNAIGSGTYFLSAFKAGGTDVGSITSNGTLTVYATTSDYRLKTVIGNVVDAGTRIDALEPIEYDFKTGGRTRGFLAHKFAEVYPNSVTGEKDAVDKEGKPVYQGMQASTPEVMADLIAEIQSLRKRLTALEAQLGK